MFWAIVSVCLPVQSVCYTPIVSITCHIFETAQTAAYKPKICFYLGYKFVYCTASSLTSSAAISAQNNFQGLILGGYTDIPPVATPLGTIMVDDVMLTGQK